jgi:hypothetical protein
MRNLGFHNIRNRTANAGISTVGPKTLATLKPKSLACLEKKIREYVLRYNLQVLNILHIYKE